MNQGEIVIYQAIDNTNFQLAIKVENDLYFYVMKALPDISKRTFWDVDISESDFKNSHEWVITRVFDRGTLDEVFSIIKYYGFNFVKRILQTTTDNLPKHSILLARAIFKLNYNDFKCSEKRPFLLHY